MLDALAAFGRHFGRFMRLWSVLGAVAAAALAALATIGLNVPVVSTLPAWVWWSVAVFTLFCTGVFLQILLDREKARKPRPNMTLREVVERIRGKKDIYGIAQSESMEVLAALESIRENALLGRISVFAATNAEWRAVVPRDHRILVRQPIPAGQWADHGIDYIAFTNDPTGQVVDIPRRQEITHNILWFDRDQISAVWPRRVRRVDWKRPIRFREST